MADPKLTGPQLALLRRVVASKFETVPGGSASEGRAASNWWRMTRRLETLGLLRRIEGAGGTVAATEAGRSLVAPAEAAEARRVSERRVSAANDWPTSSGSAQVEASVDAQLAKAGPIAWRDAVAAGEARLAAGDRPGDVAPEAWWTRAGLQKLEDASVPGGPVAIVSRAVDLAAAAERLAVVRYLRAFATGLREGPPFRAVVLGVAQAIEDRVHLTTPLEAPALFDPCPCLPTADQGCDPCGAEAPEGFGCVLPKGHDPALHVACGTDEEGRTTHGLARWGTP